MMVRETTTGPELESVHGTHRSPQKSGLEALVGSAEVPATHG